MTTDFCTEECKVIETKEEKQSCLDYNHTIIKISDEKEIEKAKKEYERNDKFTFQTYKKDLSITQTILDIKIIPLRPIFYHHDSEKKMILVYLPTKIKKEKGKDDDVTISYNFANKAYFIVQNPKATVRRRREILPIDDEYFKDKYKINIQEEWNDTRWQISDLKNWTTETKPTEPKLVYEFHDKTIRKYIELDNEKEYAKFNLWDIGTYFYELFDSYPYNDFTGLKGSGKTKCIEFQKLVCFNAVLSPDISSSATFRLIQGLGCTLLLDETEQFKNQKNDKAQDVRTLLIQGFLKDQSAIRNQSKEQGNFTPTQFNIYCPKSLAHINGLDDVLEDRCIQNINKRALDLNVKNSWPTNNDKDFEKIRNLCYRLYLDYGDEILKLKDEAGKILSVSGRELQLWLPIITLALFFEKHGIKNLVNTVKDYVTQFSKERKIYDQEESRDLAVLGFIDELAVDFAKDKEMIKGNPTGWIPHTILYKELEMRQDQYDIDFNYFGKKTLSNTLIRLGLKKERKQGGFSWLITRTIIDEIKQRLDFNQDQDKNRGPDITSFSSETSESSVQEQNFTNKSEHSEQNELSEPKTDPPKKSEHSEQNELSENNKSTESSEVQYYCYTHDAGPFTQTANTKPSGNLKQFHEKLGCDVRKYQEKKDHVF